MDLKVERCFTIRSRDCIKMCAIALICICQTNAAEFKWKLCCTLNGPFVDKRDAIDTCATSSWLFYPQNSTGETLACPAGTNAIYPYFRIQYDELTNQFKIKSLKHKHIAYVDLDIKYEIPKIDNNRYEIVVQTVNYGNYFEYNYREATSYIYIEPIVYKIHSNHYINDCAKTLADRFCCIVATILIIWIYNRLTKYRAP